MAARVITFFDRQEVAAFTGTSVDLYSPTFDVSGVETLVLETQVFSSKPGVATYGSDLLETEDPKFRAGTWSTLMSHATVTSGGVGRSKGAISNPGRYVRLKLTVPSGTYGTLTCRAIARGP